MKIILYFLSLILISSMSIHAQEISVSLETPTGKIYGTLSVPATDAPAAIVLIIAGSGPTDRDGNQPGMGSNMLKLLSEELLEKGVASLRYDKRGIGESQEAGGDESALRFDHYVADAEAWIVLLTEDERFSKVIVAGHSEGSLIGMTASSGSDGVDGFISIAGAGRPADELLKEQLSTQPPMVQEIVFPMIDQLKAGDTIADVSPMLYALFRPSVQPYMISWLQYDPAVEITKLKVPVLILQGTTDIQVKENDAELLAVAKPDARLVVIENMNHVLKLCESTEITEQMKTYSDPDLGLHKALIEAVIFFIHSI
jgi:uncharacterized protein